VAWGDDHLSAFSALDCQVATADSACLALALKSDTWLLSLLDSSFRPSTSPCAHESAFQATSPGLRGQPTHALPSAVMNVGMQEGRGGREREIYFKYPHFFVGSLQPSSVIGRGVPGVSFVSC